MLNKQKARYRLMSYHYLRKKSKKLLDQLFNQTDPTDVVYFIDSGAFTFQASGHKIIQESGTQKFLDVVSRHVDDYAEFLNAWKGKIFAAAEMDLDSVFEAHQDFWDGKNGGKWSEELLIQRDDWLKREQWSGKHGYSPAPVQEWHRILSSTGVPIISAWHKEREWEGWIHQCKTVEYNAIGSSHRMKVGDYFRFMNEARKAGTHIHGFAITKPEMIRRYSFYSVDSTSWLDGSKFGTTFGFQNGRIRYYTLNVKENVRRRLRRVYESYGVDLKKLEADDDEVVDEINLIAWLQYSDFLHKVPNKDYWKTELNGKPIGFYGPPRGEAVPVVDADPLDDLEGESEETTQGEEEAPQTTKVSMAQPAAETKEVVLAEKEHNPLRVLNNGISLAQAATGRMKCSQCYLAEDCRYHEEGAECYYNFENTFQTPQDFVAGFQGMLQAQYQRTMHSRLIEMRDGGVLDRQLSAEMQRTIDMMLDFKELVSPREAPKDPNTETITAPKGVISQIMANVFGREKKESKSRSKRKSEEVA